MPHRRQRGSRRKFSDGLYRFLSSHVDAEQRDAQMRRYEKVVVAGEKLRYIKGEDHKFHIYAKVVESEN